MEYVYIKKSVLTSLQAKLEIATKALEDIKNWDEDLEEEYDDPGIRALTALEEIK